MIVKYMIALFSSVCLSATVSAAAYSVAPSWQQADSSQGMHAQAVQELSQTSLLGFLQTGKWQRDTLRRQLGQPVKTFDGYEYFQKGVAVKWDENERAFGVLADSAFTGEIVPGITVQTAKKELLRKLGTPLFSQQEQELIGYAYPNYYLFVSFAGEKVKAFSLYRRDPLTDTRAILDMARHLQEYGEKLAEPANSGSFSIFAAWGQPDFTYHLHGIGTYAWEYPSRGIAYDGAPEDGTLTIYSNFPAKSELPALAKLPHVTISAEDALFLAEKERIELEKANVARAKSEGIASPDHKTIAVPDSEGLYSSTNIRFYNKDYQPLAQLYPGHFVNKLTWLDNNWILYETMLGVGAYYVPAQKNSVIVAMDKQPGVPFTVFDINQTRINTTKKEIVFEVGTEAKKLYTVTYQIAGERIFFTWKK
ncbi:hypothetical protein ACWKW1_02925 [Brevibacillus parabrevis]